MNLNSFKDILCKEIFTILKCFFKSLAITYCHVRKKRKIFTYLYLAKPINLKKEEENNATSFA